jgi:hypothetical protein
LKFSAKMGAYGRGAEHPRIRTGGREVKGEAADDDDDDDALWSGDGAASRIAGSLYWLAIGENELDCVNRLLPLMQTCCISIEPSSQTLPRSRYPAMPGRHPPGRATRAACARISTPYLCSSAVRPLWRSCEGVSPLRISMLWLSRPTDALMSR